MTLINKINFTTNDHAYVMTLKEKWKDKIDIYWFINHYQDLFYNIITSKSDNATFNKRYAKKQVVKIPNIEIQKRVSEKLNKLKTKKLKLGKIRKEFLKLLFYELI
jgi:hypothetical protein